MFDFFIFPLIQSCTGRLFIFLLKDWRPVQNKDAAKNTLASEAGEEDFP